MNKELQIALLNIQAKLNAPKRQKNNYGGYRYRSCEDILQAVKPLLRENEATLRLVDELVQIGDRYYIKATAILEAGESNVSTVAYAREADAKKGMDASQVTGSASSYARKYALNGLFCIDDIKDPDTNEFAAASAKKAIKPTGISVDNSETLPPVCTDCGAMIKAKGKVSAQELAARSKVKFGRVLCIACANAEISKQEVSYS